MVILAVMLSAALLVAAAVRLLPAPGRMAHGHVVFEHFDGNAQWKQVAFLVRHYPNPLRVDPDLGNAPRPWHPLFQLAVATPIVLVMGRDADPFAIELGAAMATSFLGLAAVAAAFLLALRLAGPAAAGIAAFAMALHPRFVEMTRFGDLDHHPVTPLALLVVLALLSARATVPRAITLGGVLAVMVLCDRSSMACVVLLVLGGLTAGMWPQRTQGGEAATLLGHGLVAAAIPVLAATWWWPPLVPMSIGMRHGVLLLALGVALLSTGHVAALPPRRRLAVAALALGIGAAAAAVPILRVISYTLADPVGTTITELTSPFATLGAARVVALQTTVSVLLLPYLVARAHGLRLLAGALAAGLVALGALEQRFLWNLPGLLAVALGVAAAALLERRRWALLGLLLALHLPSWVGPVRTAAGGARLLLAGGSVRPWGAHEAATWLRENRTGGRVLAFWHFGHLMNVVGEKPAFLTSDVELWGGRGGRVEAHARFFLETDHARARAFLKAERVRFVITSPWHLPSYATYAGRPAERYLRDGAPTPELLRTVHDRLHVAADAALAAELGLSQVWGSGDLVRDDAGRDVPFMRIWEVAGAPPAPVAFSVYR